MKKQILTLLTKIIPVQTAYAHCDVPCGIYDPQAAKTAAQTVLVMVQKMNALPIQDNRNMTSQQDFVRMVMTKEEHAQICKEQILILWTDYFKPEHLKMFPDLHEKIWDVAKLCSYNKQHAEVDSALELVDKVAEIAGIFLKTKTS